MLVRHQVSANGAPAVNVALDPPVWWILFRFVTCSGGFWSCDLGY